METSSLVTIVGILGGLVGSVATVIVTRVFDLFQKSQEHKYELQREFFVKKLSSAEQAVSQWYLLATSVGILSKLYEEAPILEQGMDADLFNSIQQSVNVQLQKVQQLSDQASQSFLLYFDVDDAFWDNDSARAYFSKLSTAVALARSLQMWNEYASHVVDTVNEVKAREKITHLNRELKPVLADLSGLMDGIRKRMVDLIQRVRKEMRKFEPNQK